MRISCSNAGYTKLRGSVKVIGYPLHSPISPFTSLPVRHRVPPHFNWTQPFRNSDNLAMKLFHTQDTLTRVEKVHGYRTISDPGRAIRENRIRGKTKDFSIVVGALNKMRESGQMKHVIIRHTSLLF